VAAAVEDVAAACLAPVARTRARGVEVEPRREKGRGGGQAVAGRGWGAQLQLAALLPLGRAEEEFLASWPVC